MGKQRETTLIIGEGPTEFYYFNSLRDVLKGLTIKPDYPKHTSMSELEAKIEEGVETGYSHIFCVIDMDTKAGGKERTQYEQLKKRYAKPIRKPKKGIYCEVKFFETHRCTELFFLYYFRYTSRPYPDQDTLLKDLCRCCEYRKSTDFFRSCRGLHTYFEAKGGCLQAAIDNANRSMAEKAADGREHTYSALGQMLEELKRLRGTV